jgi:hypothetical protein
MAGRKAEAKIRPMAAVVLAVMTIEAADRAFGDAPPCG